MHLLRQLADGVAAFAPQPQTVDLFHLSELGDPELHRRKMALARTLRPLVEQLSAQLPEMVRPIAIRKVWDSILQASSADLDALQAQLLAIVTALDPE